MAKGKFLNALLNTINTVQSQNRDNPNEETADSTVFDLLRNKVRELDEKNRDKQAAKGKEPVSVLDLIRNGVEHVRNQNSEDPNVKTAPKAIFDRIKQRIEERPQRRATKGIRRVINEYNLDVSSLPPQALEQIQGQYIDDQKRLNQQYANAIHQLIERNR